jgi:hypothetical protein
VTPSPNASQQISRQRRDPGEAKFAGLASRFKVIAQQPIAKCLPRPQDRRTKLDRIKLIYMIIRRPALIPDRNGQRAEQEQFHGVDAARSRRQQQSPIAAEGMAIGEPACSRPASR